MTDDEIFRRTKQGLLDGIKNVQQKRKLSDIALVLLLFEIGQELLKKLATEMPRL